jgi:hypothetical protein
MKDRTTEAYEPVANGTITRNIRVIQMTSRWPIKQVSDTSFDVEIPVGNTPLLNPNAVSMLKLSDREIEEAEYEVLRAIAIIR